MVSEIDSNELQSYWDTGKVFALYDIRSDGEVASGILPNSSHLPMHHIPAMVATLPKDQTIVLYCHSGSRSYHACVYLVQQGFDNVVNLRGGILSWTRSGYDIAKQSVG